MDLQSVDHASKLAHIKVDCQWPDNSPLPHRQGMGCDLLPPCTKSSGREMYQLLRFRRVSAWGMAKTEPCQLRFSTVLPLVLPLLLLIILTVHAFLQRWLTGLTCSHDLLLILPLLSKTVAHCISHFLVLQEPRMRGSRQHLRKRLEHSPFFFDISLFL